MDKMNTTLEIPEGSKATIQGKVIDGKNYLVVEIEERKSEFKDGDFVVLDDGWVSIYKGAGESRDTISDYTGCWISGIGRFFEGTDSRIMDNSIRYATDKEKQILLDHLAKCGYEWDAEKLELVKIPDVPEWKNFKRGDVLIYPDPENEMFVIFDEYRNGHSGHYFNCLFNSVDDRNTCWVSELFRKASDAEKARFFKWLREERGLEWNGEKLVEVLKEGDMCIFWDSNPRVAFISFYKHFQGYYHIDQSNRYWYNAIKWDGTKEQYEKVLRGEL